MKTLIKNGRVVTAVDDYRADIFIDGETVTTIGKRLDMEADVVLDAWGKLKWSNLAGHETLGKMRV